FLYKSHERSAALVMQSIIELARKMNLDLVVEGIETEDQLKLVRKLGCKVGQGYLLGRPALRGGSNKKPTVEQEAA
ncbi:MAG: EAL domain-containing protein, partial [Pseudomonadota bacterium]